eukprot:14888429-Ditylum_brightwellii.AAC.1
MSMFQNFNFNFDFEQPTADIIQTYDQGFLIEYLFDDRSKPFEEWISNRRNAAAIKLQSIAREFFQRSKSSSASSNKTMNLNLHDELVTMVQ